jgi:large repetitive protein
MSLSRQRWPLFAVVFALAAVPALKEPDPAGAKPDAKTTSTEASFRFSSSEPGSSFDCALDGAAFAPCSTPTRYTGLLHGEHEFRVRAIDRAGNMDPTPATYKWTIEPPDCGDALGTAPGGALAQLIPDLPAACDLKFAPLDESTSDREPGRDKESVASDPAASAPSPVEEPEVEAPAKDPPGDVEGSPAAPSSTVEASPSDCSGALEIAAADGDAWVLQSTPGDNKGGDSVLRVDTKDGGNARALVRFALPEIPTACQVKSATLRLYSGSYKEGRTLQALPLARAWTESVVNWSNQPRTVGKAADAPSPSSAGYAEWNVTSQVLGMYTGTNNGFLVRDSAEDGDGLEQGFNSREQGVDNPPQLVIAYG